ncbi:hypothetical protein RFI_31083 [Reticulomyxa filosa]|uniref:Uncharacterized protein n=1 Tax=Reticulomyxa filosa TaxID=46433 RepID=X6LWK8_RETFI|nr:hypothetical protein RFI_31083 [Reticulomyxa filosa]|eukprot:ETO06313.1 hypothetical protein RFI_31083 [Reticulomyxa filosa]
MDIKLDTLEYDVIILGTEYIHKKKQDKNVVRAKRRTYAHITHTCNSVLHVDYNQYYGSHFANSRHRGLLELHSCGRRDEKSSSTGGEVEGEEAKHKEDFSLKECKGGTHTQKALVGNEDIDYIGMEYLSDAKSKWNVYENFEWKDFGSELKGSIHPKDERKMDDAPPCYESITIQFQFK